jgi:hypothetical protein
MTISFGQRSGDASHGMINTAIGSSAVAAIRSRSRAPVGGTASDTKKKANNAKN